MNEAVRYDSVQCSFKEIWTCIDLWSEYYLPNSLVPLIIVRHRITQRLSLRRCSYDRNRKEASLRANFAAVTSYVQSGGGNRPNDLNHPQWTTATTSFSQRSHTITSRVGGEVGKWSCTKRALTIPVSLDPLSSVESRISSSWWTSWCLSSIKLSTWTRVILFVCYVSQGQISYCSVSMSWTTNDHTAKWLSVWVLRLLPQWKYAASAQIGRDQRRQQEVLWPPVELWPAADTAPLIRRPIERQLLLSKLRAFANEHS